MDKGFNDDELADIMSEIENLEKEFVADTTAEPVQAQAVEEVTPEAVEPVAAVEEVAPAVEEPVAAVEEVEAIVEEPEQFVENSVEADTEVTQEPVAEVAPVEEIASEPKIEASTENIEPQAVEEEEHDEAVMEELAAMPEDLSTGEHVEAFEENVHHFEKPATPKAGAGHSAMSFSVEGDMKLDLSFNVSGKIVHLNINQDGFELELDGGMKFSIPLDQASSGKKAA